MLLAGVHVREPEDVRGGQREVLGPVPRQAQESQFTIAISKGAGARHRGGRHGGRAGGEAGHGRVPKQGHLAHLRQTSQVKRGGRREITADSLNN